MPVGSGFVIASLAPHIFAGSAILRSAGAVPCFTPYNISVKLRCVKCSDHQARPRLGLVLACAGVLHAQHYPNRTVRVIVPFSPGGAMRNGTYIDMCSKLPLCDPTRITLPTAVLRGQFDGIAAEDDPYRVLQALAESGQAVHHALRHFTRQFPAEELQDGVRHPVCVLHATGAVVCQRRALILSRGSAALDYPDEAWCGCAA